MWSSGLFASFQICLQSLVARSPFCALIMIHVLWSHSVNWVVRDCQKRFRGLVPNFFFFKPALCCGWCLLLMCLVLLVLETLSPLVNSAFSSIFLLVPILSKIEFYDSVILSSWFSAPKNKFEIWSNETLSSTGRAGVLPFHYKVILQRGSRGFTSVWHYKVRILRRYNWIKIMSL